MSDFCHLFDSHPTFAATEAIFSFEISSRSRSNLTGEHKINLYVEGELENSGKGIQLNTIVQFKQTHFFELEI